MFECNFQIEALLEYVLNGKVKDVHTQSNLCGMGREVYKLDCKNTKVVVFGGGTGLSTVVGGNSQLLNWPDNPFVGLKQLFPKLDVVVCSTDDGRSTGLLLKQLPMIGIGDLRKSCLSMILLDNLQNIYKINENEAKKLVQLIHSVFNYRFSDTENDFQKMADPLLVVPKTLTSFCPESLRELFQSLGIFFTPQGDGATIISPAGHCLGNILLTASIFKAAGNIINHPPQIDAYRNGLDCVCRAIGVTPGHLYPASSTPGQLVVTYSNGVEVHGQHKTSTSRRGFPIIQVNNEFIKEPSVSSGICEAISEADLIIFAPGSIFTSIIPVLQLEPIIDAIRFNNKALKILGINFWVQEGETDISYHSHQSKERGFYVSEMIEAYNNNVPGGVKDIFHIVLSANLEYIPGNILCNYALEGKRPIYLDRERVRDFGFLPVETTIYSPLQSKLSQVIQHDPDKFTLAIRTLLYSRDFLNLKQKSYTIPNQEKFTQKPFWRKTKLLCEYQKAINAALSTKDIYPKFLIEILSNLAWENRDIRVDHLKFFRGIRIIPAVEWGRSTEWDNILGYYDPTDNFIKIHDHLTNDKRRLCENLLIALGESLLGNYIESSRWLKSDLLNIWGSRCYEIRLRKAKERICFFNSFQLNTYLTLARMFLYIKDPRTYRFTLNGDEGFLPPGLLFGLLYTWYLNNSYSRIMEYEMSLLHQPIGSLIPHQVNEQIRKQSLISFFRNEVF